MECDEWILVTLGCTIIIVNTFIFLLSVFDKNEEEHDNE